MSNYNNDEFLIKSIDSVLNQSFKNFEFIIIDDASTDNSWKIIKEFSKKDDRIKTIKNKKNKNIVRSVNKGLLLAKGKYIARFDSDDVCKKERFEKQIHFMEKNPQIGVCGSSINFINKKNEKIGKKIYPQNNHEIRKIILSRNPFCNPTTLIQKKCFDEFGLYNPKFLYAEDYEFWLRINQKYKFYNFTEPLLNYRVSEKNCSIIKQKEMIFVTVKVKKMAVKEYNLFFSLKDRLLIISSYFALLMPPIFVFNLFNKIKKNEKTN